MDLSRTSDCQARMLGIATDGLCLVALDKAYAIVAAHATRKNHTELE